MLAGDVAWNKGEHDKAVEYYVDGMVLGQRVPNRVMLVGRLCGITCETIARYSMWDHLAQVDADTATRALKRLEAIEPARLPLQETLGEEKYTILCTAKEALEHPDHWDSEADRIGEGGGCGTTDAMNSYGRIVPHKYIIDTLALNMDRLIDRAGKPYIEGNEKMLEQKEAYSALLIPDITSTRTKDTANTTATSLLRTALALRIYQIRHQKIPHDLETLVAEKLLTRVPEDPFAKPGTPMQYKPHRDETYILYSIGPDGIDDSGKGAISKDTQGVIERTVLSDSKGDMVAGWYSY